MESQQSIQDVMGSFRLIDTDEADGSLIVLLSKAPTSAEVGGFRV